MAKQPASIPKGYQGGDKQYKVTTEQYFYPKPPKAPAHPKPDKPYVMPVRIVSGKKGK